MSMTRNVELVSYLPPFLTEYKELNKALQAEDPEFMLLWQSADRVIKNEFIDTADEYGISRFEKLLKIKPDDDAGLEDRRFAVKMRWSNDIPHTLKGLKVKLDALWGEGKYSINTDRLDNYELTITAVYDLYCQIQELEQMIRDFFPANIVVYRFYTIPVLSAFNSDRFVFENLAVTLRTVNKFAVSYIDEKLKTAFHNYGVQFFHMSLNGKKELDGSWHLGRQKIDIFGGMCTQRLCMTGYSFRNPFEISAGAGFYAKAKYRGDLRQDRIAVKVRSTGLHFGISGTVTIDSYWTLNGDHKLNNSKNLNSIYLKESL